MLALIGQIGIVMIVSILIPTLICAYIGRKTGIKGVYQLVSRYIRKK